MSDGSTNNSQAKEDFRERLVTVEEQQRYQKEVLLEINTTLKEVVKTQYVLANQRKELDTIKKEHDYMLKRLHERDIERASSESEYKTQSELVEKLDKKLVEEVIPYQQKQKTYMKIISTVSGLLWTAALAYVQYKSG